MDVVRETVAASVKLLLKNIINVLDYIINVLESVNKVIGCGNLEQFDMHDLIMVFLSSPRHQRF